MIPLIKVMREAPDRLTAQEWRFRFDDRNGHLKLNTYYTLSRPSRRHGYQIIQRYCFLDSRNDTITLHELPLPDDVKQEALEQFMKLVTVTK